MNNGTNVIVTIAAVIAILVGAVWISDRMSARCVDWWPFAGKTCVIGVK